MNKLAANFRLLYLSAILFLLSCSTLLSQTKEGNLWYFGIGVGLDFNAGANFVIPSNPIRTPEGSASICNADGELLFYSDGGGRAIVAQQAEGSIWNRNDESIYNMHGREGGGWSSTQSSIITPVPGKPDHYYLFTMDESEGYIDGTPIRGLSFFEINMQANGGLGSVVDYQQSIVPTATEGLTACRHANGKDYWLAFYHPEKNSYQIYRIDGSGLTLEHSFERPDIPGARGNAAPLRFSPDGQHFYAPGILFQFDPASGMLSNPQDVLYPHSYGASFSPNSEYLYLYGPGDFTTQSILRFAVKEPNVTATEEALFQFSGNFVLPGQMQVAPDGNIYFLEVGQGESTLSAILCANTTSPCLKRDLLQFPSPNLYTAGLPNFTDHFFRSEEENPEIPVAIVSSNQVLCIGQSMTLTVQAGPTAEYLWSTGEITPTISIDQAGTYAVTVTNGCCSNGADEIIIQNSSGTLSLVITGDTLICEDEKTVLTAIAPEADHFNWSNGEKTPNIIVGKSGTYSVTVTNTCGEINVEHIEVSFRNDQIPAFTPLVVDNLCHGESSGAISLGFAPQSEFYELTWIDPDGNHFSDGSSLNNLSAGDYEVVMKKSERGCEFRYQYEISEPEPLEITQEVHPFPCEGEAVTRVDVLVSGGLPEYRYSIDGGNSYGTQAIFGLTPGTYRPSVIDANLCELLGAEFVVEEPVPFEFGLTGPTEEVPLAEDFEMEIWSNRSFEDATIEWSPADKVSCADCESVFGNITESTNFQVVVRFPDGCVGEEELMVRADKDRRVYIPNAFSPNQDGQNETLQIYTGEGVAEVLHFKIFDRWGAMVYDNPLDGWDGRLKGQPMEGGVYTWWAEIVFKDGERSLYQGDVVLIR